MVYNTTQLVILVSNFEAVNVQIGRIGLLVTRAVTLCDADDTISRWNAGY
jgi:hypothetical protein